MALKPLLAVLGGSLLSACFSVDLDGLGDMSFGGDDPSDCSELWTPDTMEPGQGGAADFSMLYDCLFCESGEAIWTGLELALGARIAPPDAQLPPGATLELSSADPSVLEVVGQTFDPAAPRCTADVIANVRAVAPGEADLMLVDDAGTMVDRQAYAVRDVASIDLSIQPQDGELPISLSLSTSANVSMTATARSADGLSVWTDDAQQWWIDDVSVADFSFGEVAGDADATGHFVQLTLRHTGTTTLHVRVGELEQAVELEVI